MTAMFSRPTGSLSARINGARIILSERSRSAREASYALPDPKSHEAAALRGKATAYREAADLIERIDRGRPLGFWRWTRKDRTRSPR